MNSCIYVGRVRHTRKKPALHQFNYRLFMMYLDLDEVPEVLDAHPMWSARGFAPAWFREADYFGGGRAPLADAIRDMERRASPGFAASRSSHSSTPSASKATGRPPRSRGIR